MDTSYKFIAPPGERLLDNYSTGSQSRPQQNTRFRGIANLVIALQRWQNALNPTVSFRKPDPEEPPRGLPPAPAVPSRLYTGRSTSGRLVSGRTESGRPLVPGVHHGHKINILMKPLPESESTI